MAAPTERAVEYPAKSERIILSRIVFMRDAYAWGLTESGGGNVQNLLASEKTEMVWDVARSLVYVTQIGRMDETVEYVIPLTALCQIFPKRAEKKK